MWLEDRGEVFLLSSARSVRFLRRLNSLEQVGQRRDVSWISFCHHPSGCCLTRGLGEAGIAVRRGPCTRPGEGQVAWTEGGVRMSASGCVLKAEPMGFAVGEDVGCAVVGRARKPGVFFLPVLLFSCSVVSDSLPPHGLHASLSFTISQSWST